MSKLLFCFVSFCRHSRLPKSNTENLRSETAPSFDLSVNLFNAPLRAAPAPGHHKIEVTPAVAMGDPGKGGRTNETVTPTLTAQVGGACSIVHVLEWKEGMAILPSSNLKVNLFYSSS